MHIIDDNSRAFTANNAWQNLSPEVAITLPLRGAYQWRGRANMYNNNVAASHYVGVSVGGANPSGYGQSGEVYVNNAGSACTPFFFGRSAQLAASTKLAIWVNGGASGSCAARGRTIEIYPIRVG